MNPHARFYVDVKDASGKVTTLEFRTRRNSRRRQARLEKRFVEGGDQVTVEGSRAKDGSNSANARTVKLADGRRVFAGSSGGDAAPNQ